VSLPDDPHVAAAEDALATFVEEVPLCGGLSKGRRRLGEVLRQHLAAGLPDYASCKLDPGLSGEAGSGQALVWAAPNAWRGAVALTAYLLDVPNPGYRAIIDAVWNHDHGCFLGTLRKVTMYQPGAATRLARRMIARGEFQIPLSGSRRVYRGCAGLTARQAARGLAWTESRDIACWFAWRFPHLGPAVVVVADVDASELIYWCNDRRERELIPKRSPAFRIDPSAASWGEAAERWEAIKGARHRR
jgi:hypothetical protein